MKQIEQQICAFTELELISIWFWRKNENSRNKMSFISKILLEMKKPHGKNYHKNKPPFELASRNKIIVV